MYVTHAVITPNFSYELHPRDKPKPALAHILPTFCSQDSTTSPS